jgi:hypothetical protein
VMLRPRPGKPRQYSRQYSSTASSDDGVGALFKEASTLPEKLV